jgi:hypothetical protein
LKDGPLHVIVQNGEKVAQFHFASGQLANVRDKRVGWDKKLPLLRVLAKAGVITPEKLQPTKRETSWGGVTLVDPRKKLFGGRPPSWGWLAAEVFGQRQSHASRCRQLSHQHPREKKWWCLSWNETNAPTAAKSSLDQQRCEKWKVIAESRRPRARVSDPAVVRERLVEAVDRGAASRTPARSYPLAAQFCPVFACVARRSAVPGDILRSGTAGTGCISKWSQANGQPARIARQHWSLNRSAVSGEHKHGNGNRTSGRLSAIRSGRASQRRPDDSRGVSSRL